MKAQSNALLRFTWRVVRTCTVCYLGVLLLLMLFEESMIFFPSKYPRGDWDQPHLAIEDAQFRAADGTQLHGWFLPHEDPQAVILFCHGNAGNITGRAHVLETLHRRLRASVLIFDYRGYGQSEGKPNEAGILADAQAAHDWLMQRTDRQASEIILMGRSIGGAVALDLAVHRNARALVLESTFTSLPDVAAVHYPWAPVRLLMRTKLNSLEKIAAYQGPLLQSHGTADIIVPFAQGKQLHEAAPSRNKLFLEIPSGDHNDPQPHWYYQRLHDFLL